MTISRSAQQSPPTFEDRTNPYTGLLRMICIVSSTGGPRALAEVLDGFDEPPAVPVLVVQHMPGDFTGPLADQLAEKSGLAVTEVRERALLARGQVYVAPGGHHLVIEPQGRQRFLALDDAPPENHCRPSADVTLRSASERFLSGLLVVVLTGMGHDGLDGCAQVKRRGGYVVVQDEASSVVWGMPGAVARAGLADQVLNPKQIGAFLRRASESASH